jgi:hypothetical protein
VALWRYPTADRGSRLTPKSAIDPRTIGPIESASTPHPIFILAAFEQSRRTGEEFGRLVV